MAAWTPDLEGLIEALGIDRSVAIDEFIRNVLINPDTLKQRVLAVSASFFERTTATHLALAELQKLFGFKIATENLDRLGEAAGTTLIKRGDIDKEITDGELANTKYLVTIGLRADDSGLLYRFREVNPDGKFVALNIEPPPYLENTDYYLEGDVQKTLPRILERRSTGVLKVQQEP